MDRSTAEWFITALWVILQNKSPSLRLFWSLHCKSLGCFGRTDSKPIRTKGENTEFFETFWQSFQNRLAFSGPDSRRHHRTSGPPPYPHFSSSNGSVFLSITRRPAPPHPPPCGYRSPQLNILVLPPLSEGVVEGGESLIKFLPFCFVAAVHVLALRACRLLFCPVLIWPHPLTPAETFEVDRS